MRDLLARALERDAHEVVALRDGAELLARVVTAARLAVGAPDVIVTDVRMPGATGLDVLRAVRSAGLDVPVLLITAFGERDLHLEAREFGAVHTFDTPFDLDDLRTALLNLRAR